MGLTKFTRQLAAWIAFCTILFAALAPAAAHAFAGSDNGSWAEVCSAAGLKLVKVAPGEGDAGSGSTGAKLHFEHCPFCSTHGDGPAILPASATSIPLPEALETHPFLFFQTPQPLAVWTTAQSRAPPFLS